MRKTIAIIGLGRFGVGLVKALANKNVDVIAIDKEAKNVARVGDYIQNAMVCDSTKEDALIAAGINNADNAIIAFGQDNESNIATTILTAIVLKNIGVKTITCRIDDSYYEPLLLKIGVDNCISPFDIASESLSLKVSSDSVMDYYDVTDGYNVFELEVKEDVNPISLIKLDSPTKFGVNIILVKREGKVFLPTKNYIIKPQDHIFIFGLEKAVFELEKFLKSNGKE